MPSSATRPAARQLPWWSLLVLGAACVVLGGVLTADPSRSLSVLDRLVGVALILTGVSELTLAQASARPRLTQAIAALSVAVGLIAIAWSGITIRALAIVVGMTLVVGGALKLRSALFGVGDERFLLGLGGATNVVVGLLALSWPGVTVLVLAILFGVRTFLFGVGQIALALRLRHAGGKSLDQRRWPRSLRLIGASTALLVALAGAAISAVIDRATPEAPGAFYTAPTPLPAGPPGTIIRSEVIDGFHAGATTYRVLYKSTGYDGSPTAVSGFIVVPDGSAPGQGRKVLAYTHGTVGVASNCAPSLANPAEQPLFLEGGAALLAAGYVIASSDYQGLGTPGPHPYLVGASEAMNELDIVRAAHNLTQAHASSELRRLGSLPGRAGRAVHRPAGRDVRARAAPGRCCGRRPGTEPDRPLQGQRQDHDRQGPDRDGAAVMGEGLRRREARPDRQPSRPADRGQDRSELPLLTEPDSRLAAGDARAPPRLPAHAAVGGRAVEDDRRGERPRAGPDQGAAPDRPGRSRHDRRPDGDRRDSCTSSARMARPSSFASIRGSGTSRRGTTPRRPSRRGSPTASPTSPHQRPARDTDHSLTRRAGADRRLLARGQLPLGRPDLPARQPAAPRAARGRAREAAAARPLRDDARPQLRLRAPEPRDLKARDLSAIYITGPGHGGPGPGRECLPRGHLRRALPEHLGGRSRAACALPPVLVPGRDPVARRARRRPARSTKAASSATRSRTRSAPRSTTPTCWSPASSATARPRPGRWRRAGTRTSS